MNVAFLFPTVDEANSFVFGFLVGVLFLLAVALAGGFEKSKQPSNEVVDAQFVTTKPRASSALQLNTSTAITTRRNIERRRV